MIVAKISGRNFARWRSVDVELPTTGLVLVTGRNGHGKSTIVEAVAQGVWGQSIRGQFGWRSGEKSGVEVHFAEGHVTRSASSKGTQKLAWRVGDDGSGGFPTRTKSQEVLDSHVGSFNVWRHACTFHTRDAARFTGATDAERKRLLEEVLELDRIETGYRRARQELSEASKTLAQAEHEVALKAAAVDSIAQLIDTLAGEIETLDVDLDALRDEARKLKEQITTAEVARAEAEETLRQHDHAIGDVHGRWLMADRNVQRFDKLGPECRVCGQAVAPEHRQEHLDHAQAERDQLASELATLREKRVVLDKCAVAARQHEANLRDAYADNVARGREAVATKNRNDARAAKLADAGVRLDNAEVEHAEAHTAKEAAARVVGELTAAADVLSYQGVRAALLDAAVATLQDMANAWLQRLGLASLSVELSSQSENKSGKVTDKISFVVSGAGGGLGYAAASTGEQRRIDIAMLFAVGDLAANSRGLSPASTLFVDELFDGLDVEGQEAVVDLLRELSATRCVVVITHNRDLVDRLTPDVHLVASDGSLEPARDLHQRCS